MYFREIAFDQFTPITAYAAVRSKGSCLLEFSSNQDRYSFIGIDPMASFTAKGREIEVRIGAEVKKFQADPYDALREMQKQMKVEVDHPLAAFTGGAIGFVSYDAVRIKENLPDRHPDDLGLPDFFFQFYRSGIAFDHKRGRAVLSTIGDEEELDRLVEKIGRPVALSTPKTKASEMTVDLSDEEYAALVEKIKDHLRAGDIFQMVPSRTFKAKIKDVDPFQVYRALRQRSPAPYLFFFDLDGYAIAGASPEKVISVQDRVIESQPIAGTCPNGDSVHELLNDPKEVAEHVMLVDLARNDVGSVAEPGSVNVIEFKVAKPFSHVTHIVSRVVGRLDAKYDALDAFKASFPAGTLSGAPKVRAMELIDQLERSRRGLYGGAIVAMDAKGNLTSCIAIRTALIKDGVAYVRAGGGVVLDSDPVKEAAETRHKARSVLEVFQ